MIVCGIYYVCTQNYEAHSISDLFPLWPFLTNLYIPRRPLVVPCHVYRINRVDPPTFNVRKIHGFLLPKEQEPSAFIICHHSAGTPAVGLQIWQRLYTF